MGWGGKNPHVPVVFQIQNISRCNCGRSRPSLCGHGTDQKLNFAEYVTEAENELVERYTGVNTELNGTKFQIRWKYG